MAKAKAKARAKNTGRTDANADPNKLVRQQAGTYRTTDGRFEVREADVGWFLVDPEQTNEFGQELIQGPFATLKAVREALPDARAAKPASASGSASKKWSTKRTPAAKSKPPAPPPPPTWIDQLSKGEAAEVRALIAALERDGINDAEGLVRRDRDGLLPAVATRLIERRLGALVDELPEAGRGAAREFVQRVAKILSSDGKPRAPVPGWTLIEIGPEPKPPNRRIDLSG